MAKIIVNLGNSVTGEFCGECEFRRVVPASGGVRRCVLFDAFILGALRAPACIAADAGPAVEAIHSAGDRAYCQSIEFSRRTECLGAEAKMRAGEFGFPELEAHERAEKEYGKHLGFREAEKIICAALAKLGGEMSTITREQKCPGWIAKELGPSFIRVRFRFRDPITGGVTRHVGMVRTIERSPRKEQA